MTFKLSHSICFYTYCSSKTFCASNLQPAQVWTLLLTLYLPEFNAYIVRLGCAPQNQQPSWVDGSVWKYSDWMPDQPNIHTDDRACVEMFKTGKNPTSNHHNNNFKLWSYFK